MQRNDDTFQLKTASLMTDLQNIQQTQQSYGVPVIGDLFRAKHEDIENTLTSVYHMIKQRVQDIDFRQEIRGKLNKLESTNRELTEQLKTQQLRYEQLQGDQKDLQNRMQTQEKKNKEEYAKIQTERNELIQQITKVQNKETQYRHDLRNKEMQIAKLQDTLKTKLHGTNQKIGAQQCDFYVPAQPNQDFKLSKISGDSDFHLMISKD